MVIVSWPISNCLDFSRARFNLTVIDDVLQETGRRNFSMTKSFYSSIVAGGLNVQYVFTVC